MYVRKETDDNPNKPFNLHSNVVRLIFFPVDTFCFMCIQRRNEKKIAERFYDLMF